MGKTRWQVKEKYNSKTYDRISVRLPKDLVQEFKSTCKIRKTSQAAVIKKAVENFIEEEKQ